MSKSNQAPSKIKYVADKLTALANTVSTEVVQYQTELAEINKALASNPSRVDAGILNARKAALNTALAACGESR